VRVRVRVRVRAGAVETVSEASSSFLSFDFATPTRWFQEVLP